MKYELVWVETKDKVELYGLLKESKKKTTLLINVHGTASNFYEEEFMEKFAELLPKRGISVLSANNRGAYVYDAYQKSGAAVEIFEDCLFDIDAWIEFGLSRGYNQFILSGHSLGTEKVVYYMAYGKYKDKVTKILLLAPADSFGSHRMHEGKDNTKIRENVEKLLLESKQLVSSGKEDVFLTRYAYGSHTGIMPKSAESFLNFLGEDSKLKQALPLATKKLENYSKIKIPIFVAISDGDEYTGIPTKEALELMNRENSLTETHMIANTNHDFEGKEKELSRLVRKFLDKKD